MTAVTGRTVLVTGANRGIGAALVEEAPDRGARRVHAGGRQSLAHPDSRVVPVTLDMTDAEHAQAAAVTIRGSLALSQSLRALLDGKEISVHAVLTGPVDSDMTRDLDILEASPASVASAIFDGVDNGEEEILPDRMAQAWRSGPVKAMERQNAVSV